MNSDDGDIPESGQGSAMPLDEAIALAVTLHRAGQLDKADTAYRQILAVVPDHPDVLHLTGLLRHHQGRPREAAESIRAAIAHEAGFADYHLNLGNVLLECGEPAEAAGAYRQALALRPEFADAWNNLGALYRQLGDLDQAETASRRAIEQAPGHVGAHNNLGMIHAARGDAAAATEFFCRAVVIDPRHADGHRLLGLAWNALGEREKAAQAFAEWLAVDPDNPEARYLHAAASGEQALARASDDYLEYTFDQFAGSFEYKLEGILNYCAPALLESTMACRLGDPGARLSVLDAGCGTGLCGPRLKPWASSLVGVDLSAGMLDEARRKGCYDQLEKAELGHWLAQRKRPFDVIVAADTLCYFGPLEGILDAAHGALRPGGMLAFTLESIDDDDAEQPAHRVEACGRFRHRPAYARDCLAALGFGDIVLQSAELRLESGRPVHGLVVSARKSAADIEGGHR